MKVKAKKTIYYHGKDGKLVKIQAGRVADIPKAIVQANPNAFEEVAKAEPEPEGDGKKG